MSVNLKGLPRSETCKPRNKSAISPLLKKSHAHRSGKDYNRQWEKKKLKDEVSRNSE